MRNTLVGVVVAVLGAAVLGLGATYAGYTDTDDSRIQAAGGTLDLTLGSRTGAVTEPILFDDLQPGDRRQHFVRLSNVGSVAGTVSYAFANVDNAENGCRPVEREAGDSCAVANDPGELGEQLRLRFFVLGGAECAPTGGTRIGPDGYPADQDRDRPTSLGLTLGPSAPTRCVRVDIEFLDQDDNNTAQGDSVEFRFDFRLDQQT